MAAEAGTLFAGFSVSQLPSPHVGTTSAGADMNSRKICRPGRPIFTSIDARLSERREKSTSFIYLREYCRNRNLFIDMFS
jgi:hypothetical protein